MASNHPITGANDIDHVNGEVLGVDQQLLRSVCLAACCFELDGDVVASGCHYGRGWILTSSHVLLGNNQTLTITFPAIRGLRNDPVSFAPRARTACAVHLEDNPDLALIKVGTQFGVQEENWEREENGRLQGIGAMVDRMPNLQQVEQRERGQNGEEEEPDHEMEQLFLGRLDYRGMEEEGVVEQMRARAAFAASDRAVAGGMTVFTPHFGQPHGLQIAAGRIGEVAGATIFHNAPIAPGSSGSPLFSYDREGRVLLRGVNQGKEEQGLHRSAAVNLEAPNVADLMGEFRGSIAGDLRAALANLVRQAVLQNYREEGGPNQLFLIPPQ